MMDVYSILFIYLLYLPVNHGGTEGVCSRLESASTNVRSFYFKRNFICDNYEMKGDETCQVPLLTFVHLFQKKFCCDNYEMKGDETCQKLRNTTDKGHFTITYVRSLDDLPTKTRSDMGLTYNVGRCDRFRGCVSTSNSTGSTYGTKNVYMYYVTEMAFSKIRGKHLGVVKDYTTMKTKQITVEMQTQHGINEDHKIQGLIKRQLITFSIGVGSVLVIILLAITLMSVCWKRRKKRKHSLNTSESGIPLTQQLRGQEENNQVQDEEHDYIDIEEENMRLESLSNSTYDSKRSSGNQLTTGGTDSEGYLHPYHSLVMMEVTLQNEIDNEKSLAEKQPYSDLNMEVNKHSKESLNLKKTTFNEELCLELNDVPNNANETTICNAAETHNI
ncbi:unnamed protein product [Mytilus coruscus]|uniref:Uncharacterized protein n=1 Tax=Mytilus coruscus TaxID=42192 RepID=A0A6J8E5W2_MYTCO|nr:unnamed protein product [Mytilus coruscus]